MPLDFLLVLVTAIWGANFSVVKYALREFPEQSFNGLRLIVACLIFLGLLYGGYEPKPTHGIAGVERRDWPRLLVLGFFGHFVYQLFFVAGVARTSVANGALIFGCTPVTVALISAALGYERITLARWGGVLVSLVGLYVLLGHQTTWSVTSLIGDGLIFGGMVCWSIYTVLSQPLLTRYSSLRITGLSMVAGTLLYLVFAVPSFAVTPWSHISVFSWILLVLSAALALGFAYVVWYIGVQRIGSSRTAIYSNLTPVFAMALATVWLGEPLTSTQVIGAAAILAGVFVTRLSRGA